ncbi:MAG: ABC transporter substrate-binding protein, partial [Thermoproteota archaeon]
AVIKALEEIEYLGTLGKISFSTQRDPPMAYHQWLGFNVFMIQYTEVGQSPDEAAIVYPPEYATSPIQYPPG